MTAANIVQQVIDEAGGYAAFASRMNCGQSPTALREIATGRRIPEEKTRRRMVVASRGRLTEADIIAITGKSEHDTRDAVHERGVNPAWGWPDDDLRYWIWKTSVTGARKQIIANRRRRR